MKLLVIFVTILVSRISCLSLDEIHSSSQTFKSIAHNNEDKSLKNAIETIRSRRQEYPIAQLIGLPLKYYEKHIPYNKNRDQQVVDDLLGRNRYSSEYSDESFDKDLLSSELALKLSQLLKSKERQESDVGHRVFDRINRKRKRSTSKQNSYLNQLNAFNNDRKHLKNVKNLSKQKNNSIKTLNKRKSSRRVLDDHFNLEENHQIVINRDTKNNKSSLKPMKPKDKTNKKVEIKLKEREKQKKIRKRKVELSVTTDTTSDRNSGSKTVNRVHNESQIPTKDLEITDKSVVSELNDILSDDNKTHNKEKNNSETKLEKTNQNFKPLVNKTNKNTNKSIRRMTKRNDPNIDSLIKDLDDINAITDEKSDDIIIYPNIEKIKEKDENELQTNTDLDDWLRREFYENMAKTLATMRKKRSEDFLNDQSDVINAIEDTIGDNIIAIDESDENRDTNNDITNSDQLSDDSDNDYVIAAIDDDIKDKIYANDIIDNTDDNEDNSDNNDSDADWDNAEEKNPPLKIKRSVSPYFPDSEDNTESNDINSRHFTRVYDNLESVEDSIINEALDLIRETASDGSQTEVNSNKIANRLDAAYDIEDMRTALDDLKTTFDKISHENDNEIEDNYETPPVLTIAETPRHKLNPLLAESVSDSETASECFGVEMVSSDCSSIGDLLPSDDLRYSLTESCNWHQICYTCGEIYGLLSSDCDAGFLEASRLSCAGSPSCEAFARLVLVPLRQSRVFYKSSVPQTCYRYQCIRDFLLEPKK